MNHTITPIDTETSAKSTQSKAYAPKLRFKECNGAWEKKKLEEVVKIGRGKSKHRPRNANFLYGGKYPFIQTGDIKAADLYLTKYSQTYSEEGLKQSKLWDEDTLCVTIAANIAETAILKIKACFPDSIIGLIPKENQTTVLFVKHLFDKFKIEIQSLSQGIAQDNLNQEKLSKIEFGFPSLPEQQKIAAFLSAVDEKIQLLTRKKELLTQYKKGVMQQLFSGKLRFKDEQGRDFPEWEEKTLGEVAHINPRCSELPESFIYIDLDSVEKGQLLKENNINKVEAPSRAQRKLSKKDILYQTVRPYQMNNLLFEKEGNYVASTGYAQLRSKENALFLFQLLHTEYFVNKVMVRCTGTSYPSINSTDLSAIKIFMPSFKEQQKIATYLSAFDSKINSLNSQITQIQNFKKGLLQQMFV
jgi:type I restriction enzyme, S subunit